jgi:hypothetical protein
MFLLLVFLMVLALQLNMFDTATTEEDLKLGNKHDFKSVIEYRKILGQTPISLATQVNQMNKETTVACL